MLEKPACRCQGAGTCCETSWVGRQEILATAQWHLFLACPSVAWAQLSPKHDKGGMKAVTFIPFQCRSRESHRPAESDSLKLTGAWTPTTKHRPGRSQGGIDHFTLTLSLMGRGSGSLPPEQGPVIIHHLEKSLLETPALPKTVAIRCLALSSGTVSN